MESLSFLFDSITQASERSLKVIYQELELARKLGKEKEIEIFNFIKSNFPEENIADFIFENLFKCRIKDILGYYSFITEGYYEKTNLNNIWNRSTR